MAVSGSRSRIGGVPVITVEAPAPRRAVLAFRVGRADETLPIGGITHLFEHRALLPFQEQPSSYGGFFEGDRTIFWVQPSEAEIGEFFGKLCANLANLPLDRLADQARILETEARSRKHSAVESLLNIRYGSRGWGSMVFPEYGLMRPDPDRVRQWAERWFTAGNAALGVSGPADGISLELRPGNRMPPPDLNPVPIRTPAWMHQRQPGIAIGFIGPRSIQFAALLRTLVRHGRARLRFEESLSYEVSHHAVRLTDGLSHGSLWADGLPESMSRVWTGLLAVIDQLRLEGPSEAELREDLEMLRKDIENPAWPLAVLDRLISNELLAVPTETTDELLATLDQTKAPEYQALLEEMFASAIALVPDGVAVLDSRFTAVPIWSADATAGREYRLRPPRTAVQGQMYRLLVGESAVSLAHGPGQFVTVPYRDCQAVLAWDDGSRTLFSADSFRLHVRPADWAGGDKITQALDAHLSKDLGVPMGPRPNPDPESLSGTAPANAVLPRR